MRLDSRLRAIGLLTAATTAAVVVGTTFCGGAGIKPGTHGGASASSPLSLPSATTEQKADGPPGIALVETRAATPLGLHGLSANGRIQPRGLPTRYWFEHGPTTAYGSRTAARELPPRLGAFYKESFETRGGWQGGLAGDALVHQRGTGAPGGAGGFVRYAASGDLDVNHEDGIGPNELVAYLYTGLHEAPGVVNAALSGGDPDLRGARISAWVRGSKGFVPNDAELVFWVQSTPDPVAALDPEAARWSNWALTRTTFLDAILRGGWQRVELRLPNDTHAWTYAGRYVASERKTYEYWPLDSALAHANGDIFQMLVFMEHTPQATGTIDLDEVEIAYRNRNVLAPSNGGRLVSAPQGGADPSTLTDGWRNGEGRAWASAGAPNPKAPLEITYELERPVAIDTVQIHQNPAWPSKDVEVLTSDDGKQYTLLTGGVVPETARSGKSFAFLLRTKVAGPKTKHVRIRISSGYRAEHWGLGEIEIFGDGARMTTDDDWYDVNADIDGLAPGTLQHFRLVAESEGALNRGPDLTFTVPKTTAPLATTGDATRIAAGRARLDGRLTPLGVSTDLWFEYGPTASYGSVTPRKYGGRGDTPRHVTASVGELKPGTTYHFRLVAESASGISRGDDTTFVAR